MNTFTKTSASVQTTAAATTDIKLAKALTVLVEELVGFGLMFVYIVAILSNVLAPLVNILSNAQLDRQVVGGTLAWIVGLVGYGVFIGSRGKSNYHARLTVQWGYWALAFAYLIGRWSFLHCIAPIVCVGGLLFVGSLFGLTLARPQKYQTPSTKKFFRELAVGLVWIIGFAICFFGLAVLGMYLRDFESTRIIGKPAPSATFVSADKQDWSLSDQQGKVVWIQFVDDCQGFNSKYKQLMNEQVQDYLKEITAEFSKRDDFVLVRVSRDDVMGTESCFPKMILKDQSSIPVLTNKRKSNVLSLFTTAGSKKLPRASYMWPQDLGWLGSGYYSIWHQPDPAGFEPDSLPATYIVGRDGTVKFARVCQARFDLIDSSEAIELVNGLLENE